MESNLIKDLLTENRYWTFWKSDWSECIYVFWGGKTKWKQIEEIVSKRLGADFIYERQVELKTPELTFE